MSRGMRSRSLSTKLSCRWGKSAMKHLEKQTKANNYAFIHHRLNPKHLPSPKAEKVTEMARYLPNYALMT